MKIRIPNRKGRSKRPKTYSRLPQCNKSNALMRRFYSGRRPTPQGRAKTPEQLYAESLY